MYKSAQWIMFLALLLAGCGTGPRISEPVEQVRLDNPVPIAPPRWEPEILPEPPPPFIYSFDSRPVPVSPPAPPAIKPIPADKWPHVPYVEIRAYLYNLDGHEGTPIINEKGRLDRSVYDWHGVILNQKQTEQLFEAMYQPGEPYGIAHCYRPRHAFVFYDAAHKPVAQFEVCFGCNQYTSWPRGLPDPVNLLVLSQLVQNLGLPIFENDKDYEALKLRPKGGARKKP